MSDGRTIPELPTASAVAQASLPAFHQRFLRHLCTLTLVALGATVSLRAQPAGPVIVDGETMSLAYSHRKFDGVPIDGVVLSARSVRLATDTFGAWTPHGEGTTSSGFVLRHRRFANVYVSICPFSGHGPGKSTEAWRMYLREVARRLGPETQIEDAGASGTPGGIASFASWNTREAAFATSWGRTERHVLALADDRGVVIMLSGPVADVTQTERDFRFLLARLERQ